MLRFVETNVGFEMVRKRLTCASITTIGARPTTRRSLECKTEGLRRAARSSTQGRLQRVKRARYRVEAALLRALGGAACAGLAGCFLSPIPDLRTPVDRARELESKCTRMSEASPMVSPAVIDTVEPASSYVSSGPVDRQAILRGARIHLRPLPAVSRESLQRDLECHQVRVTLGRLQGPADDPYVLPGRWVDIDVDSEGDGFVALVRTDKLDDAKELLGRARRFARATSSP
jgi:hypothetical protein